MTDVTPPPTAAELERYLTGQANALEAARLRRWVHADPTRKATVEALKTIGAEERHAERLSDAWQTHAPAILGRETVHRHTRIEKPFRAPGHSRLLQMMGVFGAMVMTVVALRYTNILSIRSHLQQTPRIYATRVAQLSSVSLIDGTVVTLAPQSRLTIPSDFGTSTRTISVTGEASIHVRTSAGTPFIVHAGSVHTRVLGTTFTVRWYAGDRDVQVAVTSGKVMVGRSGTSAIHDGITLVAGNVAHVEDSVVTVNPAENAETQASWTNGRLVFQSTPVPNVLATVGRWYGYDFRLADSAIAVHKLTTTLFLQNRSETLSALQALLDVTMTFDGSTVTLRPRRQHDVTNTAGRQRLRDSLDSFTRGLAK